MRTKDPKPGEKYVWIRMWCQMLGSYEYFAEGEIEQATIEGLRDTVCSVRAGHHVYLETVTNLNTRHDIIEWARVHHMEVPQHVLDAWNKKKVAP